MNHTFVIPAYKESPYLEKCVESLLSQTVKSKIIITTSTPSDFLNSISVKYDLPLLLNPVCNGIASDWNFAYSAADTEYVTLAHQDDLYSEKYTEKCLKKAEKHPGNLIVFTGYAELHGENIINRNLNIIIKKILLWPYLFTSSIENKLLKKLILLFGSPIPCPGVIYNKNNLKDFKFDAGFSVNPDWNAWLEMASGKGGFVIVNGALFLHRIHKDAETSKAFSDNRRRDEDLRLFKTIWPDKIAEIISKLYSLSYKKNKLP